MALEASGCAEPATGWTANHLVVYQHQRLVAALPLYQKLNSYGEYVFDFEWANAYYQNGINYYPKLLSAIPFTPCTGPRIGLVSELEEELMPLIISRLEQHCLSQGISSWHLLFPHTKQAALINTLTSDSANSALAYRMMKRVGFQYHWFNKGYKTFDDFLSLCRSKKRKNIKKERRAIQAVKVHLERVEGVNASGKLWMTFFKFYQRTYLKRSGNTGYLNWAFFEYIANAMPEKLLLVVASHNQRVIGMSLFFKGKETLFGRYWGASDEYEFLHFEACYYQGIEYCIEQEFQHFDAGAQGEHKIPRGFEPIETCSFHWIAHPQFAEAIENFLEQEKHYVKQAIQQLQSRLPYKEEK